MCAAQFMLAVFVKYLHALNKHIRARERQTNKENIGGRSKKKSVCVCV